MYVPPQTPSAPAGWYPEPGTPGVLKYWNGTAWEEWRQPANAAPIAPAQANGIAVTALVFSIVGVALDLTIILGPLGFLLSLTGVICGAVALRRAALLGRRGTALWGLWLGAGAIALQVLIVVGFIAIRTANLSS